MKLLCVMTVFFLLDPFAASARERVALVIGNGRYAHNRPENEAPNLLNPVNDANAFSKRLKSMNFEVIDLRDATARDMVRGLNRFKELAKSADLGVIYYAGHGMEITKEGSPQRNHLIPVDAVLEAAGDEQLETLGLHTVLQEMKDAQIRLKVVILDCCRNNPFGSRSWLQSRSSGVSGGLAEVSEKEIPEGTLIVYSGAPGATVPDGLGDHSPFTGALLEEWTMEKNLPGIFAGVANRVNASEPWIKFDGSGRTFAAFHGYRLDGKGNKPEESNESAPREPLEDPPLVPPLQNWTAASVQEVAHVNVSSQLGAQSTSTERNITYGGNKVVDGDATTAWVEGAEGVGNGEWVEVFFKREVRLSIISVFAGYGKNRDIYFKNGRPRTLLMRTDSRKVFTLRFKDTMAVQRFALPQPQLVRSIRFEIQDATQGNKYDDTAISEILFE